MIKNFLNKYNFFDKKTIISFHNYCPTDRLKIVFTAGDAVKNSGGTKLYNLWVKLLRENGYNAYIATVDGKYDKWLVNHQPVISYKKILEFKKSGYTVKIVSGWLDVPFEKILGGGEQFYYFDAELHWTIKFRNKLNRFLKQRKIAGIATHSRYIQSWYMANYGFKPPLINEWSDEKIFFVSPRARKSGLVGCMVENAEEERMFEYINKKNDAEKTNFRLMKLTGTEKEVAKQMRSVDIFIGLNFGKDDLWGEGCPRTQQEGLHSGAVLVAFDVLGNREYLIDNFSGILVDNGDTDSMWNKIRGLMDNRKKKEFLRKNGISVAKTVFSDEGKIVQIENFLGLKGMSFEELKNIFQRNFWLQKDEIQFLSRYAHEAKGTIVEIGSAFGGSSTVFLLNKAKNTKLYSIDPFVKDSMGGFQASKYACHKAVSDALSKKNKKEALKDWNLINDYSYEVAKNWDKKIDLLFIDGSHLYKDVKKDFEDWGKFVEKDGLILFHDSRKELTDPKDKIFLKGWNGPTKLVKEILNSGKYKLVDNCYSISVIRRI
jgi:predicted O-methyltransferase YrrM